MNAMRLLFKLTALLILPFINAAADIQKPSSVRRSSATVEGFKNSMASSLAAACSKTILAPFDTLKTVQQYHRSSGKSLSLIEASKIIIARPKGFLEFYVSKHTFKIM